MNNTCLEHVRKNGCFFYFFYKIGYKCKAFFFNIDINIKIFHKIILSTQTNFLTTII